MLYTFVINFRNNLGINLSIIFIEFKKGLKKLMSKSFQQRN